MFVPFEILADSSKIWIYQFNRSINQQEAILIGDTIKEFCGHWEAHGAPLRTSFQLVRSHFLILAVDEKPASASGCSIDGSVRVLKELGAKLNIDLFDRTRAAVLINGEVVLHPIIKLKDLFAKGTLKATDLTFNNLVATKGDYLKSWLVPVEQSWLMRYLPKSTLA